MPVGDTSYLCGRESSDFPTTEEWDVLIGLEGGG